MVVSWESLEWLELEEGDTIIIIYEFLFQSKHQTALQQLGPGLEKRGRSGLHINAGCQSLLILTERQLPGQRVGFHLLSHLKGLPAVAFAVVCLLGAGVWSVRPASVPVAPQRS